MNGVIKVTKIRAARSQLETAVLLYFDDGDPVSIHSLAAAAHELVSNLADKRGEKTPVLQSLFTNLPDDLYRIVRNAIRTPQNFFKHADRDPEASLEFSPDFSELVLFDAIATYVKISGETPWVFEAFAKWFFLRRPSFIENVPALQPLFRSMRKFVDPADRKAYLRDYRKSLTDRENPR